MFADTDTYRQLKVRLSVAAPHGKPVGGPWCMHYGYYLSVFSPFSVTTCIIYCHVKLLHIYRSTVLRRHVIGIFYIGNETLIAIPVWFVKMIFLKVIYNYMGFVLLLFPFNRSGKVSRSACRAVSKHLVSHLEDKENCWTPHYPSEGKRWLDMIARAARAVEAGPGVVATASARALSLQSRASSVARTHRSLQQNLA